MSLRFYGNDEETYVAVTRAVSGTEFYCVQSPDLSATEGNFVQVDVLPETVRELDNVRPEDLGLCIDCAANGEFMRAAISSLQCENCMYSS